MHEKITSVLGKASAFLYPDICLNCKDKGNAGIDLCNRCYKNLLWIKHACQRCALPMPSEDTQVCGSCSTREIHFDRAYVPFLFDQFVREAIHEFKFNSKLNYGALLAHLLVQHIQNRNVTIPDVLLPVPLYKKRMRKRGFNQALEIARILSKKVDCKVSARDIYRERSTHTQMDLPAAKRHANVKNAFALRSTNSHLKGKHIAIIDDVMTTGSTVNEVAKCLKKAEVKRVDVWCIARVA